jgi:uncharacterized protein
MYRSQKMGCFMRKFLVAFVMTASILSGGGLFAKPWFVEPNGAWTKKLSSPQYEIQLEYGQKIPMRDNVNLVANIWHPKAEGQFPVVLIFTPYDKNRKVLTVIADPLGHAQYLVPRGYVVVAVDSRGRYDSEGESYFFWHANWREGGHDGLDVNDCLSWLGTQKWSSGKIGMTGGSGLAFVQWLAAPLSNPYLKCIVPYVSPDDHYENFYPGGAFRFSAALHCLGILSERNNKDDLSNHFWDWEKLYKHLPMQDFDKLMLGKKVAWWQDFINHPSNDNYWRPSVGERLGPGRVGQGKYSQVHIPTLNVTGWYDTMQQPTINNYMGMVEYGPKELQDMHKLIIGPWFHEVGPSRVGDLDFGSEAAVDFYPVELRWFDYWLKGIDNGIVAEPAVSIFVTGINKWQSEDRWPLKVAQPAQYYFHSNSDANTRTGNGVLNIVPPGDESEDCYIYNPENPVPSFGGNVRLHSKFFGPQDQRGIGERGDILFFTSEPIRQDIKAIGPVFCKLFAASSASDTDFTAKLIDVLPDGYARILIDGIVRTRYRESFSEPELIVPGRVYEYRIDLGSIGHVFQTGHRIQIEISSSNFPKYDRNPNTGHKFGTDSELIQATQKVFHDKEHPSCMSFSVVE